MEVCFHGAAEKRQVPVTRSGTPVGGSLVDCGMFQGGREADGKNRRAPQFRRPRDRFRTVDPTHTSIIQACFRDFFRAWLQWSDHMHQRDRDLLEVMLRDAAHIQEKEADGLRRQAQGGVQSASRRRRQSTRWRRPSIVCAMSRSMITTNG